MKTILFVCTGNTCRSSMAAALARSLLQKGEGGTELQVLSAGTAACPGDPASSQAVTAMAEEGIDLLTHQASQLTPEMVHRADWVLTMTRSHKEQVLRLAPEAEKKVFTLKEFALRGLDKEELQRRQEELARVIREKSLDFRRRYERELGELERERQYLNRRLREVEQDLRAWEERWQEEIAPEQEEADELSTLLGREDIMDPFGQPVEAYRRCARELKTLLRQVLPRIHGEAAGDKKSAGEK